MTSQKHEIETNVPSTGEVRSASIEGFKLVHTGFYNQMACLWEVVGISVGEDTDFDLFVTIFDRDDREEVIKFKDVVSFRVHHESVIDEYWYVRQNECIDVGLLYSLKSSSYLKECSGYRIYDNIVHYLIAAVGMCVEVLAGEPPILPTGWEPI